MPRDLKEASIYNTVSPTTTISLFYVFNLVFYVSPTFPTVTLCLSCSLTDLSDICSQLCMIYNNHLATCEDTCSLILFEACWSYMQTITHEHADIDTVMKTHTHSPWEPFLPQASNYCETKTFLSTLCVCSCCTVRSMGEFQSDCMHFCKLDSRVVLGCWGAGGEVTSQASKHFGNNSKKPELKFLYLLWGIMMPLLACSYCVTIYFHLLCAQQLLLHFASH